MRILVTGAGGFVGKNLCQTLCALRHEAAPPFRVDELMTYGRDGTPAQLDAYCAKAELVFHLAGVSRAEADAAFWQGNRDLTAALLEALRRHRNPCPVVLASSVQASLEGRYDTAYGQSKKAAEELLLAHGRETGSPVLIYRLPNLFGKWCRPYYNSAVATFCHQAATGQPLTLHDPDTRLELLYIDDLLQELLCVPVGREHRRPTEECYGYLPGSYAVTLGEIASLLERFRKQTRPPTLPDLPAGSFEDRLYATYLSYLPRERLTDRLEIHRDDRGSFTELMRPGSGQISVNITHPGAVKGRHWHHSKWEVFVVVSGRGRIRLRRLDTEEELVFDVSGEAPEAVYILPGYLHSLENLSETEELVTVMWASELYDPERPDTYREK